jgi:hypothetical protein
MRVTKPTVGRWIRKAVHAGILVPTAKYSFRERRAGSYRFVEAAFVESTRNESIEISQSVVPEVLGRGKGGPSRAGEALCAQAARPLGTAVPKTPAPAEHATQVSISPITNLNTGIGNISRQHEGEMLPKVGRGGNSRDINSRDLNSRDTETRVTRKRGPKPTVTAERKRELARIRKQRQRARAHEIEANESVSKLMKNSHEDFEVWRGRIDATVRDAQGDTSFDFGWNLSNADGEPDPVPILDCA